MGAIPRAYTDQYGYFHIFDLNAIGNYTMRAEKYHYQGSDGNNPTAPPFSPLTTKAESAVIVGVHSMSATTMNDVKIYEGDTGSGGNDNGVTILDYSTLSASFGLCLNQAGYRQDTDFRENNCTDLIDFSVLGSNYGNFGSVPPTWTTSVLNGFVTP